MMKAEIASTSHPEYDAKHLKISFWKASRLTIFIDSCSFSAMALVNSKLHCV